MWPFGLLSPARAIAFDTVLALVRRAPGARVLESDARSVGGVPTYVMMPLDFACDAPWLADGALEEVLTVVRKAGVAGIMVDVWWGLCESAPGRYDFARYEALAAHCRRLGLRMQATMCFHACGGNVGDTVNIPLPQWASDAADAHNAWFCDRQRYFGAEPAPNRECISLAADHVPFLAAPPTPTPSVVEAPVPVDAKANGASAPDEAASLSSLNTDATLPLRIAGPPSLNLGLAEIQDAPSVVTPTIVSPRVVQSTSRNNLAAEVTPLRTPIDAYGAFIRAFCDALRGYFEDVIVELQVGMGPCGELRYPSYPLAGGKWAFPGIGEFQCYDKRMMASLSEAANAVGHPEWGVPPDGAGAYNDTPWHTSFFGRGGGHRTPYGKFFMKWYSDLLLEHGDAVLRCARAAAPADTPLAVKISGVHWWYFTAGRAAEATAGYYMSREHDFYARAAQMLKKHGAILDFTCLEMKTAAQPWRRARCGPRQLVRDVFRTAARAGVTVAGENALECYDWPRYAQIITSFRWTQARAHGFTLLRLGPEMLKPNHLRNVERLAAELRAITPRESKLPARTMP